MKENKSVITLLPKTEYVYDISTLATSIITKKQVALIATQDFVQIKTYQKSSFICIQDVVLSIYNYSNPDNPVKHAMFIPEERYTIYLDVALEMLKKILVARNITVEEYFKNTT